MCCQRKRGPMRAGGLQAFACHAKLLRRSSAQGEPSVLSDFQGGNAPCVTLPLLPGPCCRACCFEGLSHRETPCLGRCSSCVLPLLTTPRRTNSCELPLASGRPKQNGSGSGRHACEEVATYGGVHQVEIYILTTRESDDNGIFAHRELTSSSPAFAARSVAADWPLLRGSGTQLHASKCSSPLIF